MSNDLTRFRMYSDDELVTIGLNSSDQFTVALATRLGDALDTIATLEQEATKWNPFRRKEHTKTEYVHDA